MAIKVGGTTVIDDNRCLCNIQNACITGTVTAACLVGNGSGLTDIETGGAGDTFSNVVKVAASSPTIPAGWPVSYIESTNQVTKTLGDPSVYCLNHRHSCPDGILSSTCINCTHPYCCHKFTTLCQVHECCIHGSGVELFVRTGHNNFLRVSKRGTTVPLLVCDWCNGCCCFSVSCWGIQNLCVDETNNCLVEISYGHVPECACPSNLTLFDVSQWNYCRSRQVPYGSITAACCFCCCDSSTNCNPRRTTWNLFPCQIYESWRGSYGIEQCINCNTNCCNCKSIATGAAQRLNTTSNGVVALRSSTNNSLFVLSPMTVKKCFANPNSCDFCCVNKCLMPGFRIDKGSTGWEIWKLTKCSGKDEYCTVPNCIVKDEGYSNWRMGYLNKAKTLMYGEQTKFCHCYCCSGQCFCEAISCGFMHVQAIDDDFCLSPYHGCIASTNRTYLSYLHAAGTNTQHIKCLEGQRRFWPLTEDDNGWVLWTEPVSRYILEAPANCRRKCVCLTCSYLRVGAFKPVSTGTGFSSANIACVCYDASGTNNHLCVAGFNFNTDAYNTNCPSSVWQTSGNPDQNMAKQGVAFKNFVIMHDVHPAATAGNAYKTLISYNNGNLKHPLSAVYSCVGASTCVLVEGSCEGGYLPMAAIMRSNFDATECKSCLEFGTWISLSFMCGQNCVYPRMCCSDTAVGQRVKVNFCVDNSTCCLYLTSCSGSFADYPNFYSGSCQTACHFLCSFKCLYVAFTGSTCICTDVHLSKTRTDHFMAQESRSMFYMDLSQGCILAPFGTVADAPNAGEVHYYGNCCQVPLCCSNHDGLRDVVCEITQDASRSSDRRPNSTSPGNYYTDLFPWSPAVYTNYHRELDCETCTDTRYQWSLNIMMSGVNCYGNGCSGLQSAFMYGIDRCIQTVCDYFGRSCFICRCCGPRVGHVLAHHAAPPSRFYSCMQCLAVTDRIKIHEYTKATGACTEYEPSNFNTTEPFVTQCGYTVGSGKAMLTSVTGIDFKYFIANTPNQANVCKWVGFASQEGAAGSTICMATINQGSAPVHACWGSSPNNGFNTSLCDTCKSVGFLSCFTGSTVSSCTCSELYKGSPCFVISAFENPDSAGSYRLNIRPACDLL